MPDLTSRPTTITDDDLKKCVKLVKAVSDRANGHDLKQSENVIVKRIHDRMLDNGWLTWFHKSGTKIDACAFFQDMLLRPGFKAMCLGFDKTPFPMDTDAHCVDFLNTVMGNGNDGLLRDFFLHTLPQPSVYVVDMPLTAASAKYNQLLNNLFVYMQTNSPGTNWSMTLDPDNDTGVDSDFWGGSGLNLWKLTVS
jgi:hypothetical protein